MHYKNNGTGHVLLNSRICCSSMGEIYIRRHTGHKKTCRAITGCLKPYLLAGIALPDIMRDVCARMERTKQMEQETHSLFGHIPGRSRLKSRKESVKLSYLLLLLFAFQSMFISIWVSCLEIAEFRDNVRRSAP